jgi:4-oxalocrotonate tautomerase
MPYVNVKVGGPLTRDQKERLSQAITRALEEIAGKPRDDTYVTFDEYGYENWGVGDRLLDEIKGLRK